MARVILTVLGGYFIILLFWVAYEWLREEYPKPAAKPVSPARIQHPFYHELAADALQRFFHLPELEKDTIKESLESNLISMEQWLTRLDQSDYQVMCIGEHHEESKCEFLAEEFLAKFSVDVLMLEATPKELKRLTKRMNSGRVYFPLLDADIIKILRTVRAKNQDIKIFGIEETDEQRKEKRDHSGSRDKSIADNFWKSFHPGMRRVILIGALHCTNETHWLFTYINGQAPLSLKNRMFNAWVLGEHQSGPLEAFLFFLDEIGIEKKNFVNPDTSALHPHVYELFQEMNRQVLKKIYTLIVFRI